MTAPTTALPGGVPARALAVLLLVGSVLGTPNLLLDGVVRPGASPWVYGAMMAALFALGVVLFRRNPVIDEWWGLLLVVMGGAVYAGVVVCLVDPGLVASPVMLLFVTFTAGWVLSPRTIAVQLVGVVPLCWLVLAPDATDTSTLVVQVVVHAGVLGASAVVLMVLRRRVERLARETHLLARVDPLTGLPNRRDLAEQAPRLFARVRETGDRVAVLLLDLDRFKEVNDRFGHATGDAVLVAVAARLRERVPASALLARTGGEEVVVLAAVADPEAGADLGELVRRAVAQAAVPDVVGVVTASVGVALDDAATRTGADDVEVMWRLVERADAAMYAAKASGRDRVVVSESRRGPGPDQLVLPLRLGEPAPRRTPALPLPPLPLQPAPPVQPAAPEPRSGPSPRPGTGSLDVVESGRT